MGMDERALRQKNALQKRMRGMVDSRSMKGIMSRGRNIYNGGNTNPAGAGRKSTGGAGNPADNLGRLEQMRDLAKSAREASMQFAKPQGPSTPPPGMAQASQVAQDRSMAMQQGAMRQAQPVGQQLPGAAPMGMQGNVASMRDAMMRRLKQTKMRQQGG